MNHGLRPHPVDVPRRLIEAFSRLNARPILVGGKAVQVWTGLTEGLFQTFDLDFITSLRSEDLVRLGLGLESSGRHVMVDGVPVEFPSGPLAVGDLQLDPLKDTCEVPTLAGDLIRCIRPEACVLDRVAQVAAWQVAEAYAQAAGVAAAQSGHPGWDGLWIDAAARKAGLSKLWTQLKHVLERGAPSESAMDDALRLGWD